jgi:transmembrane sensor
MSSSIRQEASEWFVEFRTGEPSERARKAFLTWLKESPAHMAAYLEMAAVWDESGAPGAGGKWSLEALLRDAQADEQNVIALELPAGREVRRQRTARRGSTRIAAIAASVFIMLAATLGGWLYWVRDVYATAIGEQRSIMLSDGSTVELNARSRVRIRFMDRERRVDLLDGQALFTVAKSRDRPFVVASRGARVRAVGTQFDVYRKSSGTTVTVLEGTVAITPDSPLARNEPSLVRAGEQVIIGSSHAAPQAHIANIGAATAWTQRRLIFDNTPLQEVAAEFNRYNRRQLLIRDSGLKEFGIDGVFSSTDPSSLVNFLRTRPGVTVRETETEIVVDTQ